MSWTRLCVRYNNNPLRCVLFASRGNDDTSGFNYNLEGIDKLIFYGSIEPQNKTNKFCYSYKKGSDGLIYMDFNKVDTCLPPSNEALNIQEGGYGGSVYLYTSKPDEQLNLTEYIYRYATSNGITRSMISKASNANWANSNEWSGGGTFWAYNYDKMDDNQFIICGRSCTAMDSNPNPLFQFKDGYCYNKGNDALSDFSNKWNRKIFDYDCDGSLIHQERLKDNGNADGEDHFFLRYNVDPRSRTDPNSDMYATPPNSNFSGVEVIPIINIFKNVSGGADDVYGMFKKLTLNDKYLFCQRPKSGANDNIIKHSNSVKYMKYSAVDLYNDIKNKYIDPDSNQCKDVMKEYCKINWGKAGNDCYNYCRNNEANNDTCEPIVRNFCLSDNNINLPICKESINNIIGKYPDRRPALLKDLRNKWLDLNKNRLMDDDVLKFCKADDTTIAAKQSNLDLTIKNRCDSLYKDFCSSKSGSLDPKVKKICGCINGKTIANILIPQCHDSVCMQDGYKTADMIGYTNCPKCVNILSIKNIASDAQIANIKQDMICKVTENTTTTTTSTDTETTKKTQNDGTTTTSTKTTNSGGDTSGSSSNKNTSEDSDSSDNSNESDNTSSKNNIFLYMIFALFIILCILGIVMATRNNKPQRSSRRHSSRRHSSRRHR